MIPNVNVRVGHQDLHSLSYIYLLGPWLKFSRNVELPLSGTTLCNSLHAEMLPKVPDIDAIRDDCYALKGAKKTKSLIRNKAIKLNLHIDAALVSEADFRRVQYTENDAPEMSSTMMHVCSILYYHSACFDSILSFQTQVIESSASSTPGRRGRHGSTVASDSGQQPSNVITTRTRKRARDYTAAAIVLSSDDEQPLSKRSKLSLPTTFPNPVSLPPPPPPALANIRHALMQQSLHHQNTGTHLWH